MMNPLNPLFFPCPSELLDLDPLPVTALQEDKFINIYEGKFTHFNPIQTQIFHCLYHNDCNALIGMLEVNVFSVFCRKLFILFRTKIELANQKKNKKKLKMIC